jgi:hypothetical protein
MWRNPTARSAPSTAIGTESKMMICAGDEAVARFPSPLERLLNDIFGVGVILHDRARAFEHEVAVGFDGRFVECLRRFRTFGLHNRQKNKLNNASCGVEGPSLSAYGRY